MKATSSWSNESCIRMSECQVSVVSRSSLKGNQQYQNCYTNDAFEDEPPSECRRRQSHSGGSCKFLEMIPSIASRLEVPNPFLSLPQEVPCFIPLQDVPHPPDRSYLNLHEHLRVRSLVTIKYRRRRCCHRSDMELCPARHFSAIPEGGTLVLEPPADHCFSDSQGIPNLPQNRWIGVNGNYPQSPVPHLQTPLLGFTTPPPQIVVTQAGEHNSSICTPSSEACLKNEAQSATQLRVAGSYDSLLSLPENLRTSDPPADSISLTLEPPRLDATFRNSRRNSMIDLLRRYGSNRILNNGGSVSNLRKAPSKNSLSASVLEYNREPNGALLSYISALYAKILVVMGMAFPIAEVISSDVPLSYYKGFYLYLYSLSLCFLLYVYLVLLRTINLPSPGVKSKLEKFSPASNKEAQNDAAKSDCVSVSTLAFKRPNYSYTERGNHGSMYLRMGAVAFGIGSMIYSGLEVGTFFELNPGSECASLFLIVTPACSMLFTFVQMYFVFLNSRVAISRHRIVARFGLMHMIATNLCKWLDVLVQETKHEIASLGYMHEDGGTVVLSSPGHHTESEEELDVANLTHHKVNSTEHHVIRRSVALASSSFDCHKTDIIGKLVENASPFLFPCTIEYSLLCAGVLYVMWKNINKPVSYGGECESDISTFIAKKTRHHYSVDCAHANRGLFMGILMLVLTIISLILFFVLISNDNFKDIAVLEASIIELCIYSVAIITVICGMVQMRELEFLPDNDIELDNILLLIAQTGVYIYACFTVIGGHFNSKDNLILPLMTAVVTLTQTTLQTLFILDASRRCCKNYDQLNRKPGREMVTFLLVCNLAMWAINTFETSRADAHPTQLHFYGVWAWTIISHISMPLAIFYRFHVTVCLCEIWKRAYKLKQDYM